jgi:dephospho-CoA kinase
VKPLVLGFVGKIGSGKSTVSTAVAEALGWPRTGFGDYVRALAAEKGLAVDRQTLQRLGESLVNEGPTEFCRAVLNQANWEPGKSAVVDGIRHTAIVSALRETVAPTELLLVFVAVADSVRETRVQKRDGQNQVTLNLLDSHSTESEVETSLSKMAHLTVDGNLRVEVLASEIVVWAQSRG